MILMIAKKFWREIVIGLLLLSLFTIISVNGLKIDKFEAQVTNLTTQLSVKEAELLECREHINLQNEKIELAAQESLEKMKELNKVADSFKEIDKNNKKTIENLRKHPLTGKCEDVTQYLKDSVKDLKW